MNTLKIVGIDITKPVCQVSVWMADGSADYNHKI